MPRYKIEQTATAVILWEGEAESKAAALDAMAEDAGYKDYADCAKQVGEDDGVVVREVAAEEPGESSPRITAHELFTKVQRSIKASNEESWLVEAITIERIPDEQRGERMGAVAKALRNLQTKTWQGEAVVVWSVLLGTVVATGQGWVGYVTAAAVGLGWHHASVSERLREQEEARQSGGPVDAHHVECVRWLSRYFWGKELLWPVVFIATRNWAALTGCAIFVAYQPWRRLWRRWYPLNRPRPQAPGAQP